MFNKRLIPLQCVPISSFPRNIHKTLIQTNTVLIYNIYNSYFYRSILQIAFSLQEAIKSKVLQFNIIKKMDGVNRSERCKVPIFVNVLKLTSIMEIKKTLKSLKKFKL